MAEVKTKPTNGKATAEDVAESVQPVPIRPALATRINARDEEAKAARQALAEAQQALDDMLELAREIEQPPDGYIPWRAPNGDLMFVAPKE